MLDDLGSYRLSDFLLFSQDTYFRLFELYNQGYWPLHLVAVALGAIVLYTLRSRRHAYGVRITSGLLAVVWAWVGWAFFLNRYATINIAAPYFAALFGLEAVLLLLIGTIGGTLHVVRTETVGGKLRPLRSQVGLALLAYAVFLHPLAGLLAGRTWRQLSVFGMGPDPTAIATLGILLFVAGPFRWLLLIPGVLWCLIGTLTAYSMNSIEAVPPVIAVAAVLLSIGSMRKRSVRPVEP